MEAANIGGREADVAPAADPTGGRMAGWTPADPGPLGLAAFAGTTFMLSLVNAGLVGTQGAGRRRSAADGRRAGARLRRLAQFVAGLWEFRTGNTFGAVAFCSYGAFWISFFFIVQSRPGVTNAPAEVFSGLGLYLWMWGIFTAYMFIASLRTTGAVALVFLLLAITFLILGIGNSALAGTTSVTNGTIKLGGWVGIITAIAAWYASFAAVINSTFGRVMAPVVPLSR